jgi:hypothetical protein
MFLDVDDASVTAVVKNHAGEQVGTEISLVSSGLSADGRHKYIGVYMSPEDDMVDTGNEEHSVTAVVIKGSNKKTIKAWFQIFSPE